MMVSRHILSPLLTIATLTWCVQASMPWQLGWTPPHTSPVQGRTQEQQQQREHSFLPDGGVHEREHYMHGHMYPNTHPDDVEKMQEEEVALGTEGSRYVDPLSDRFEPLRLQYITTNLNEGVHDKLCTRIGSSVQVPCHNDRQRTCTVQCTADNTLTAERRQNFIAMLDRVKAQMQRYILVQRTESNTINYQGHVRAYDHCASSLTTPQAHDLTIFVTLTTSSDPVARRWLGGASGGTCLSDNGKPIAGVLLITADAFIGTGSYTHTWEGTIMHELVHALQYSMPHRTFPYGEVVKVGDNRYLRSPWVLKYAREHFQCPDLPGALLENDGCHCHLQLHLYRDAIMSPVAGSTTTVLTQMTLGWIADSPYFRLSPTALTRHDGLQDVHERGREQRCADRPARFSCPNNNCGAYGSCIENRCVCHDRTDTSPGCTAPRRQRHFHPMSGSTARPDILEVSDNAAANLMGPGAPGGAHESGGGARTAVNTPTPRPSGAAVPAERRMDQASADCIQVQMNRTPCTIINACEASVYVRFELLPKKKSVGTRRGAVTLAAQAEHSWPNGRGTVKICVRAKVWVFDRQGGRYLGRRDFAEGQQVDA
eukprot:TRINITY_DN10295_c0_g2_i1.p1 TRINITY_DN10295_c0_g2~~TRINITY_DN10295_c0_g2_i1.p1  ORF type:complete len:598 (-),score=107.01 TRINITY_DN10295_c0_g2_i1:80-1873(-)